MPRRSLLFATMAVIACGGSAPGATAPATPPAATVRPSGETRLHGVLGGVTVAVRIMTHKVHVGRVSEPPPVRLNSCTYSKIPCNLTDVLQISVAGNELNVPRSAFADLGDLNRARLALAGAGRFQLKLEGGDASEAYEATIIFTRARVLSRSIRLGELDAVAETTTYFVVPPLE